MTPITALGSRYGIQGALGRSVKRASAGGDWWDLGGTITSCVAAFQCKNANSLEASMKNLAQPSLYDLVATGIPTFESGKGLILGSAGVYVTTTITESLTTGEFTFLFRVTDRATSNFVCGNHANSGIKLFFYYGVIQLGGAERSGYSGSSFCVGAIGSGSIMNAITDSGAYSADRPLTSTSSTNNIIHFNRTTTNNGAGLTLVSAAFYKTALTKYQVNTIQQRMNAL